jgi:hypothetical protein
MSRVSLKTIVSGLLVMAMLLVPVRPALLAADSPVEDSVETQVQANSPQAVAPEEVQRAIKTLDADGRG